MRKRRFRRLMKRHAKAWKRLFGPVCANPYCKERKHCKHGRRMV